MIYSVQQSENLARNFWAIKMPKFLHLVRSSGSWTRMVVPLDVVACITETSNKFGKCTQIFLKDSRTINIQSEDMTFSQIMRSIKTIDGVKMDSGAEEMFPTDP